VYRPGSARAATFSVLSVDFSDSQGWILTFATLLGEEGLQGDWHFTEQAFSFPIYACKSHAKAWGRFFLLIEEFYGKNKDLPADDEIRILCYPPKKSAKI
jgi:hypothetical protein